MSKPGLVATVFLLLYGSLPFNFYLLPPDWCVTMALAFFVILVRWGPKVVLGRFERFALWSSLAIFCSGAFNHTAISHPPMAVFWWPGFALIFGLWLAVSKTVPRNYRAFLFRRIALMAFGAFAVSVGWMCHAHSFLARNGEYYGFDFLRPVGLLHLSSPYDYYLVHLLDWVIFSSSLAVLSASSIAYFFSNRLEASQDRKT